MNQTSLCLLPTEMWVVVCQRIETKRDLQSFSCTCKLFQSIAETEHGAQRLLDRAVQVVHGGTSDTVRAHSPRWRILNAAGQNASVLRRLRRSPSLPQMPPSNLSSQCLRIAAYWHQIPAVRLLLTLRADPNGHMGGRSPLEEALMRPRWNWVVPKMLIAAGAKVTERVIKRAHQLRTHPQSEQRAVTELLSLLQPPL